MSRPGRAGVTMNGPVLNRRLLWLGGGANLALGGAGAAFMIGRERAPWPKRALPALDGQGRLEREGASLWHGWIGRGEPVLLLHGGLSSSRAWADHIPSLVQAGRRVILVDSRGHGQSTLGSGALTYERLVADLGFVLDHLGVIRPDLIGWSDGANVALRMAMDDRRPVRRVLAFGADMGPGAVRPDAGTAPIVAEVAKRLRADYQAVSPVPAGYDALVDQVRAMQAKGFSGGSAGLARVRARAVMIAGGARDEFILPAHFAWIASAIPGARLFVHEGTGHFMPWTHRGRFGRAVGDFLSS
ncbi:alpha/beta fold hydrolase [Caulobacter segnis]|uniref:alpha/beta fold hydrolase n=1 Tax=Caulobacter segnis TaxID=88688 RepID=UPI00240EFBE5|nr:alpha/beta fold hydrolase [Caulobacter segnis]MDG2520588.1 alpha/beta fold hydrolase [Caulobacter segnis]